MNILDEAIELENKGRQFYLEGAAKTTNPTVRSLLESLAADEVAHAAFLRGLKRNVKSPFTPSPHFAEIRHLLKNSDLRSPDFTAQLDDVRDVLKAAIDFEDKARLHYDSEAFFAEIPEARDTLHLLAREEDRHHALLEGLLMYLDNPGTTLDSPEFQWDEK